MNQQANGKWSASEKLLHINFLELKSAFLSIQALIRDKRSITVSLNMDNTTAVAYVNHQGGTHSPQLLQLALQLWNWCVQRDIVLVAHHAPGKSNSLADRESRVIVDNSDWMLDPSLIRPLLSDCKTALPRGLHTSFRIVSAGDRIPAPSTQMHSVSIGGDSRATRFPRST